MAESGGDDGELFTALYPALRRFAGAIRPAGTDADDLVQEALARTLASRSLAGIENPTAYLRTAIVRIASNNARGDRRRARRQREQTHAAEIVGGSEAAARQLASRALRTLRSEVGAEMRPKETT